MRPLCFVLMPFGRKSDSNGRVTDFDAVYQRIIVPAVDAAGLEPLRADEEKIGGTIHKPMFERLMLCQYALADITGANPNVYYELGIRHALRPRSTVIVFAEGTTLPFDIALLRGIPYRTSTTGEPLDAGPSVAAIAAQLTTVRDNPYDDSPLFQLIEGMPHHEVDHSKTDVFRDRVQYSARYKARLAAACKEGSHAVQRVIADPALSNLLEVETGVIIDMFLSLRDVRAHAAMIELYGRMPEPLKRARLVREQLAFALNREGRAAEAIEVLERVIAEFGASSETNGLLGRVYKDRWEITKSAGKTIEARAILKQAVKAYLDGFQADWRDAYPGVNAVTLMEMMETPPPEQAQILPVVRYAASRRAQGGGDYWDHATLLELAVIAKDEDGANETLSEVLAKATASWHIETTQRNLRIIREARERRGVDTRWIEAIENVLAAKRREIAPRESESSS